MQTLQKHPYNKKRTARLLLAVLLLILLEQGIKLVIVAFARDARVPLIPGYVEFAPYQNTSLSWFGALGVPLFDNMIFGVVANVLILVLCWRMYSFFDRVLQNRGRYAFWVFALYFAGALCSLVDKVLWGGSWDYIRIVGWFVFDLKDCYLNGGNVLMVLGLILYGKKMEDGVDNAALRYVFTGRLPAIKAKQAQEENEE